MPVLIARALLMRPPLPDRDHLRRDIGLPELGPRLPLPHSTPW